MNAPVQAPVPARLVTGILHAFRTHGFDAEAALDGTGYTLAELERDRRGRVPWELFVDVTERAMVAAGSPAVFEGWVADWSVAESILSQSARYIVDPLAFTRFTCELSTRAMYRGCVSYRFRQLAPRRAHLAFEITDGLRGGLAFWHGTAGLLAAHGRVLGTEPYGVEAFMEPMRADFYVTFPASRSVPSRIARATRSTLRKALASIYPVADDIAHELLNDAERMARAAEGHAEALARVEATALAELDETDLASFARTTADLLIERVGCSAAAIGVYTPDRRSEILRDEGTWRHRSQRRDLTHDGRRVGWLLVAIDDDRRANVSALLDQVAPVIASRLAALLSRGGSRAVETAIASEAERDRLLTVASDRALLDAALAAIPGAAWVESAAGETLHANEAAANYFASAASDRSDREGWQSISLPDGRRLNLRRRLIDELHARAERAATVWTLTPRQREVLEWAALGRSNRDMAITLRCALATVEVHMTQVMRKAGVDNRTELVARFWSGS